jgi:hypothetical protein
MEYKIKLFQKYELLTSPLQFLEILQSLASCGLKNESLSHYLQQNTNTGNKWQAESLFKTFLIGCYAYCCIIGINTNVAELPIKTLIYDVKKIHHLQFRGWVM